MDLITTDTQFVEINGVTYETMQVSHPNIIESTLPRLAEELRRQGKQQIYIKRPNGTRVFLISQNLTAPFMVSTPQVMPGLFI